MAYPYLSVDNNITSRARYLRCRFETVAFNNRPIFGEMLIDCNYAAMFKECFFNANKAPIRIGFTGPGVTYESCRFIQDGATTTSYTRGTFYGKNEMTILTGFNDLAGYVNLGELYYTGNVNSVGGVSGRSFTHESNLFREINIYGSNSAAWVNGKITFGFTIPTSGTWVKGSLVVNSNPTLGAPLGWKCLTTGSPGTWAPYGIVGGVRAVSQADSTATDVAEVVADLNALISKLKAAGLMG